MLEGLDALAALFILLPGFMSARIAQMMSARGRQTEFERIVEALLFSFFIYVVYVKYVSPQIPLSWNVVKDASGGPHYVFAFNSREFFLLVAIAVALGAVSGFVQARDVGSKILLRLKLTDRTSRESVWKDVFLNHKASYVQVGLADGRSAIGLLASYSDTDGERAIYLTDASWVVEAAGETTLVPETGVDLLLTDRSKIQYVMFLDK
jgi:hypothetical protein